MDYSKKTCKELIEICKEKSIKGYSGKKKEDLIKLVRGFETSSDHLVSNITLVPKIELVKSIKLTIPKSLSPLRYPGGKSRACLILEKYVKENYTERKKMLSPFVGGGSFELYLASTNAFPNFLRLMSFVA